MECRVGRDMLAAGSVTEREGGRGRDGEAVYAVVAWVSGCAGCRSPRTLPHAQTPAQSVPTPPHLAPSTVRLNCLALCFLPSSPRPILPDNIHCYPPRVNNDHTTGNNQVILLWIHTRVQSDCMLIKTSTSEDRPTLPTVAAARSQEERRGMPWDLE